MLAYYYGQLVVLLLVVVIGFGCGVPPKRKVETVEPKPAALEQKSRVLVDEEVQKKNLQMGVAKWERTLDVLITSLIAAEKREDAIESVFPAGTRPRQNRGDSQLSLCLERIKQIKDVQQHLAGEATAVERERMYMELVDHYLFCFTALDELRREYSVPRVDPVLATKAIEDSFAAGQFYKVIALYRFVNARETAGSGQEPKNDLCYALSLIQLGLVDDAVKVAEEIVESPFPLTAENAPYMFRLGEWLIDRERYDTAELFFQRVVGFYRSEQDWYHKAEAKVALFHTNIRYLKVRNRLDQAIDLLGKEGSFSEAYSLCLAARNECVDPSCYQEVESVLSQLISTTVVGMEGKLAKIGQNIEESNLAEARSLLLALEASFPGENYPYPVREKLVLIKEKKRVLQQMEGEWKDETDRLKLEKAEQLLESAQYEEAVSLFEQLRGTPYEGDAEMKKQAAIDGFARERRTQAGQLFFDAEQSDDPELRKTYLVESYTLLKDLVERYPNNKYSEKIEKNLEDVRGEIEEAFPDYFYRDQGREESLPQGAKGPYDGDGLLR